MVKFKISEEKLNKILAHIKNRRVFQARDMLLNLEVLEEGK